jgi:predicted DNA-binding transcriptional regulator AlpA
MELVRSALRRSENNSDQLLTSGKVRKLLGGITDMSLWRWTKHLGFPQPDHVISRRKYWRRGTIESWLSEQRKATQ